MILMTNINEDLNFSGDGAGTAEEGGGSARGCRSSSLSVSS